ncbi:MHYT domain-containing protein [Phytoactinopolyspora limicola]|uniref:MHYT domain-containing protein n=1 Tax=Phytoactinopolyspora limicola TaxID=2715536 RepID=UPI00140D4640|nr:MHYT domain-containing protein [Phytoactinopolyspora limicola]
MEHLHHFFQYGPITAVVAYIMACVGAGLGLRCVVRAFATTGSTKRSWLITGALAIGSGIWTMHLVAILGFAVDGSPVRFDVGFTLLSLLVAIVVVLIGVFAVGYTRSRVHGAIIGGISTGVAIVGMHYVGMSAMQIHGTLSYDIATVGLSVVVAIGAATVALAVAFLTDGFRGTIVAALLMGAAASITEYTGIAALQIEIIPGTSVLPGASAVEFVFPFIVVFGSFLFLSSAFVALSPIKTTRMATVGAGANHEPEPGGL